MWRNDLRHALRVIAVVLVAVSFSPGEAEAQNTTFTLVGGSNEPVNDELGIDADFDVFELAYARRIEDSTWFEVRIGESDLSGERYDEGLEPEVDTEVRYVLALVEYEFDEIFGSTSLFAGPGAYDIDGVGRSDEDFGFALGVGIDLPVARRLGVVAELTYHWISFDEKLRMLNLTIGGRFSF